MTSNITLGLDAPGGFALISTVLECSVPLPVRLTEHIVLDRPTPRQLDRVREWLHANTVARDLRDFFECETHPGGDATRDGNERLPTERWRYFLLAFDGPQELVLHLLQLLAICRPSIESEVTFLESGPIDHPAQYGSVIFRSDLATSRFYVPPALPLDGKAISDIHECVALHRALNAASHEGILRAVDLIHRINSLQANNFQALAWFSVIEMLLTHQPQDREIGDSIRHQLLTKIPLLSARMPEPLTYEAFGALSPKKIWDDLYSYRSAVAHGNHVDFKGSLKPLRSPEVALDFLQEATRRIARQAMREPDLVTMLKDV